MKLFTFSSITIALGLMSAQVAAQEISTNLDASNQTTISNSVSADAESGNVMLQPSLVVQPSLSTGAMADNAGSDEVEVPVDDSAEDMSDEASETLADGEDMAGEFGNSVESSLSQAVIVTADLSQGIEQSSAATFDAVSDVVAATAVTGTVESTISSAVDGAVAESVSGSVANTVTSTVSGSVDNAIDGAVNDAVEASISNAVEGTVENTVENSVATSIGSLIGA